MPDNIQYWNLIPAGSQFVIGATGNDDHFDVMVKVSLNGAAPTTWWHEDLFPDPKRQTINADDNWVFSVLVVVPSDPPGPVTLDAHIEAADGTPDPDPAHACKWSLGQAGQFPIAIFVTNR
jgi:hypothetical protein